MHASYGSRAAGAEPPPDPPKTLSLAFLLWKLAPRKYGGSPQERDMTLLLIAAGITLVALFVLAAT